MLHLKPLSKDSISKALVKAKHYRLLNEPWQAESICRDILAIDPTHQFAILHLILSISDQLSLGENSAASEAKDLCTQLTDKYQQKYYAGIIEERSGKAAMKRSTPRAKYIAYDYYREAMSLFEEAEKIQPKDNQDAVLRWNACVRSIQENNLSPSPEDDFAHSFLE